MFTIFCPCIVKSDQVDAFIEISIATGKSSLEEEPGCIRYDVLRDRSNPNVIFFYEIYADKAAFDRHVSTAHYAHWEKTTQPMIKDEPPMKEMDLLNAQR